MYFADKSGAKIASKDGNRFIIMESDFVLPVDVDKPLPIPGKGSAQLSPVEISGGFKADFYGISYKVFIYRLTTFRLKFLYIRVLNLCLGQGAVDHRIYNIHY